MDTVGAGGTANPHALLILLGGVFHGGVDLVGNAGYLEETAALCVAHIPGAPFQSVQNLLTGNGLQARHIAEGVDFLTGLVADVPGDSLVPDAAAVHNGHIHIQTHVVKQVVEGIGGKVAGVGLLRADQAVAVLVVVIEGQLGGANLHAQLLIHLGNPVVLNFLHSSVGAVKLRNQLGGNGTVFGADDHAADGTQVLTGLGQHHFLAGLVLYHPGFHGAVAVAVDKGIQSGDMGNDLGAGPGAGGSIQAQVTQGDDLGSPCCLGCVDSLLHIGVQLCAIGTAGNAVDVVAVFILEVSRGGLGEGLGSGDTDNGYLLIPHLKNLVAVQHILSTLAVRLMVEVAGEVRERCPALEVLAAFHAVVKLVVAQGSGIITCRIHQIDDGLALVQRTVSGALGVVAGVHQQHMLILLLHGGLQSSYGVVAHIPIDIGVHIVGVENYNVVGLLNGLNGNPSGAVHRAVIHGEVLILGSQRRVGGLYHAAGEGRDIVGQDHVILHHIVQYIDSTGKHGKAVAQIPEGVVVASQVVGSLQIQGVPAAGLLIVDLYIVNPVFSGGGTGPYALVVLLNGAGDGGVNLVSNTGNLEEAAALGVAHIPGTPFQGIQQLLAGDGLEARHIAEGMDFLTGLVGKVAGDGLVPDAAAIHNGYIHIQAHIIKEVVKGIGGKVAGVGLLRADQTIALGIIVVQGDPGGANLLTQLGIHLGNPGILLGLHSSIGTGVASDQLGGDGAVSGNHHLADGVQVLTGLGQGDGIAVLVIYHLVGNGAVAVSVDESVQAGHIGNHLGAGPGAGRGIQAQVAQANDLGSAFGLGCVDGLLHIGVEGCTVGTAGNAVDVVAVFILEVSRGGLGEGLGGSDAHDGYLLGTKVKNLVAVQHILPSHACGFVVEVAGEVGEVCPGTEVDTALHAVVKLVVTQGRRIIACCVHQADDGLALVHRAVGGALGVVARIHQQHIFILGLHFCFQRRHGIVAHIPIDVGMHIVGVKDDDVFRVGSRCSCRGHQSHHQDQSQQHRKDLSHD